MKVGLSFRVMLALLLAVFLPLGQALCALGMSHHSAQSTVQTEHHGEADHDCCPESTPHPASPADPCCCDIFQLPSATASASITVEGPTSVPSVIALAPVADAAVAAQTTSVRFVPDARSGSPPGPSEAPQSPRSPPISA